MRSAIFKFPCGAALVAIGLSIAGVWGWTRSTPWAKARRFLAEGDASGAVEVLTSALEKKPCPAKDEEVIREILTQAFLLKGAVDNAEQESRALREKFPGNFSAALWLGVIDVARDRLNFAAEYLEAARAIDPSDLRPYLLLADIHQSRWDAAAALKILNAGLIRFPDQPDLVESLGDLAFLQGRFQEALARYDDVLRAVPEDRDTRIKLINGLINSGDLRTAEVNLDKIRLSSAEDDRIEMAQANILALQGRWTEAVAVCERSYRKDNNRQSAGISWALWLAERGRMKEAEAILADIENRLPPLRPEGVLGGGQPVDFAALLNTYAYRKAARSLHRDYDLARVRLALLAGRLSDAGNSARRALSRDTESFEVMLVLSNLARLRGETADRLKWLERAVTLYKEHPGTLLARGWANLDLGRTSDAIVDARMVADAYPRLSTAQALLSRAYLMIGRAKEAASIAEHSVSLNEGDPEAHLALALAEEAGGKAEAVESEFKRAIELNLFSAESRAAYGKFLKKRGRSREAAIQLAEAARLEPSVYSRGK